MSDHIHPIFDKILSRDDKEKLLGQKSLVIWMTGLSGSGKSTLAKALEQALYEKGILTKLLDGDNLRTGLNKGLGFTEEGRIENIRRVAEASKLFMNCGVVTICSFVSPTISIRNMAKEIIGSDDFYEVHIKASFDECARRDVKGLYQKALNGEIKNFTGLDAPFEEPESPFIEIDTQSNNEEQCLNILFEAFYPIVANKEISE